MKIQFIYTFKEKEQEILEYPVQRRSEAHEYDFYTIEDVLKSKESLSEYALNEFNDEEKNDLIKISCCVYLENGPDFEEPEWYKKCNGRLWFENGKIQ